MNDQAHDARPHKILRLAEVLPLVGLSRSTLYVMIGRGEFPPQRRLGSRAVGWIESEVQAWVTSRPQAQ